MLTYSLQTIAKLFKFTEAHSLSHRNFSAHSWVHPKKSVHFAIECIWMYRKRIERLYHTQAAILIKEFAWCQVGPVPSVG